MATTIDSAFARTGRTVHITDHALAYRLVYHAIACRKNYGALRDAPDMAFRELMIGLDGNGQFVRIKLDAAGVLIDLEAISLRDADILIRNWRRWNRDEHDRLQAFIKNASAKGTRHD